MEPIYGLHPRVSIPGIIFEASRDKDLAGVLIVLGGWLS